MSFLTNFVSSRTAQYHRALPTAAIPQDAMIQQFTLNNIFQKVDFEQEAKDTYGNLHPQYMQPVKKGFEAVQDYVELYSNDILNGIRELDWLCTKTSSRKIENYEKCKEQVTDKVHKKILIPIVNSSALLYKVANQCLLKGNSIEICSNIVSDHTHFLFKLAAQRIKEMKKPLQDQIPDQMKPPMLPSIPLNNAIKDQ